jgi:NAD(P)-dependent dehydrogenase (short-subunit alcohol dehydrogenase family)
MTEKIVFVTGVSTGLGRAFAQALLDTGYKVVGTVRKREAVSDFEVLLPGKAIARILDVTDERAVHETIKTAEAEIGPIHALINNAGYGYEGTLEESPMEELRHQFEVNVFGAVAMIKAVLPFMRERRSGRILNVTSMGGLMTMPGLSYYHGSKFALEGISGSLGKEVKSFGVFVTAVEPGMFRTDWAGRSMIRSSRSIPDYDTVFDPIRAARAARSGNQPGDPAKAGSAIVKLLESPNPPAHLLLGPDALEYIRKDQDALQAEFAEWESVTRSTNFDETHQR